jgi:hypothetical protein
LVITTLPLEFRATHKPNLFRIPAAVLPLPEESTLLPLYLERILFTNSSGISSALSDVYASSQPFSNASSDNSGLPAGTSGIQTIRFGMEATPFPQWTFSLDYYQYKAQNNLVGSKELGTEFDYGVVYRYSGLVTVRAFMAAFSPGDAFPENNRRKAELSSIEINLRY